MTNIIVERVLNAHWYPDICKDKADYKALARCLHPDINNDPGATAAFSHLNKLKHEFESGFIFSDDAGEFHSNYLTHRWTGDVGLLRDSMNHYDKMLLTAKGTFDSDAMEHFMKYVPNELLFEGDELVYRSSLRSIPLSKVIGLLPEVDKNKHVNWIYSRMIEFVAMLESLGITHAGLNPDSILVVPDTHAITVVSFYHMCTQSVNTISAKYKQYYPTQLFADKLAGSYIDINLIKKTAIAALGDPSGAGVKLRANKEIETNVLNYLMLPECDALLSMRSWRELLNKHFIKEFVPLNI